MKTRILLFSAITFLFFPCMISGQDIPASGKAMRITGSRIAPITGHLQTSQGVHGQTLSNAAATSYTMDFENIQDFSLTFGDWTVNDVDKHDTYGILNHSFPHQSEPMAFLCFNPALVAPSMASDQAIQPHSGLRFGACFSSNPPSNNDWFISPKIQLGTNGSFSFWIKSYNDTYLVDDYLVAVSTTDNSPASFISVTGTDTLHTTTAWVKKTFSLVNYNNQLVYVAIHCVSNDHFLMMIDDLEIKPEASANVTADFSSDKTTVNVGESVSFIDQSSGNPTSWLWAFTGATPATSTLQNPSAIKYAAAGTYPVKLKVSNGTSADSITKEAFITVTSYPSSISLDFESVSDFSLVFSPWNVLDVRGGNTYGINQPSGLPYAFPHANEPMAYICFNPSATTPPMTNLLPHTGQKLGCSFSSVPPLNPNDKWLITPRMGLGINPRIEFWVQTYNPFYGDEKYNVAVSVSDQKPSSFVLVNATPESAPAAWTKRSYDLSAYTNQDVYIGIQCITDNGFIFLIDDIMIESTVGIGEKMLSDQPVIFPNPATDQINLNFRESKPREMRIKLINAQGVEIRRWNHLVFSETVSLDVHDIPRGVYVLTTENGTEVVSHKVSVVH
ncbi:MAG: choice-of-anchor J domain-containing protein [Bacteroidales bacterium]